MQEKGEDEQVQDSIHRSGGRPIRKSSQSKASKFFGVGAAVVEEAGPVETLKIEEEGLLMWRNEVRAHPLVLERRLTATTFY